MTRHASAFKFCFVLAACLLAGACARLPVLPAHEVVQVPSPNFDERRPNFVIIHQTSGNTAADALATLTSQQRKVSAHYLIGRDGQLYQLVDERQRAWHAGVSYWGGSTDLNSASIGIELDNTGEEPFTEAQIARLLDLLAELKARYRIPVANFIAHGDVAPGRKVDPSAQFPWARLAAAGFGLWCATPVASEGEVSDVPLALQALGYNVSNPTAALAAFRRHYMGVESEAAVDANDARVLDCVLAQKGALLAPPENNLPAMSNSPAADRLLNKPANETPPGESP